MKKHRFTSILTDLLMMNVWFLVGIIILLFANFIMKVIIGRFISLVPNHVLIILVIYLPWLLANCWLDIKKQGSLGKQMFQLRIHYKNDHLISVLLRNILKWSPCFVIVSMGYQMYNVGNQWISGIVMLFAILWIIINLSSLWINKGQGHVIDFICKTQVLYKKQQ